MVYQEYLIENIPDTIKTGEKTPEGEEIAKKLGLNYNGVQQGITFGDKKIPSRHTFTIPNSKMGTTFLAHSYEEAKEKLEKHKNSFQDAEKKSSFKNFYNDFKKN